ncbi:MAG: T9SS type A sorting domain-containing protein [Bacteroidia bacterium]|nr:T9SS type A sorting domain-containing protein [Bacteroidia bacterium]
MMKKNTPIRLILVLLLSCLKPALAQWKQLGAAIESGPISFTEIVTIRDTAYVAFKDANNNDRLSVKKWNGMNWVNVGPAGISESFVDYVQLATDGISPYVAFQDASRGNRLSVMKFDADSNKWISIGPRGFTNSTVAHLDFIISKQGIPMVSFHDGAIGGKAAVMVYEGQSWNFLGVNNGISTNSVEKTAITQKDSMVFVATITTKNGLACPSFVLEVFEFKYRTGSWTTVYSGFDNCANEVDIAFNETEAFPYLVYRKHESFTVGKGMVLKYKGTNNQWDTIGQEPFSSIAYGYNIPANQLNLDFVNNTPVVMYREAVNTYNRPAVSYYDEASNSWKKMTGLDSLSALNGAGNNPSTYFHGSIQDGKISLVHQAPQVNYTTAFVYQFACQPEQPLILFNDTNTLSSTPNFEHYQWYTIYNSNSWVPIAGATQPKYTITQSGVYGLEVKTAFCIAKAEPKEICFGYDTSTQVVNNEIQVINTPEEVTYEWFDCQSNQKIANAQGPTFQPTTSGSYRVEILSLQGKCRRIGSCIPIQLTDPTSLDELELSGIQVFPNPAHEQLNIQYKGEIDNLSIWNINGKLIQQHDIQTQQIHQLDISRIEPGCYLIQLKTKTGHTLTKKFIKTALK